MGWVQPTIKDEEVKIRFLKDWMGHPANTDLTVWRHVADDLIKKGFAVEFKEFKAFKRPVLDKMVRQPAKSK